MFQKWEQVFYRNNYAIEHHLMNVGVVAYRRRREKNSHIICK